MRAAVIALLLILATCFAACEKNTAPKIPQISLLYVAPDDSMKVNIDTSYIVFSLADGDGDIGNNAVSGVYLKDSRYDSIGFVRSPFPDIDQSIEDPKKGLEGTCLFIPVPQPEPRPRKDTAGNYIRDTLSYELYIMDRAGNESNHIVTHPIIVVP